jgi:hypothetical protein
MKLLHRGRWMMLDDYTSEDCIAKMVGITTRRVSKSLWANRLRDGGCEYTPHHDPGILIFLGY